MSRSLLDAVSTYFTVKLDLVVNFSLAVVVDRVISGFYSNDLLLETVGAYLSHSIYCKVAAKAHLSSSLI